MPLRNPSLAFASTLVLLIACAPSTSAAEARSGRGARAPSEPVTSSATTRFEWSGEVAKVDISTVLGDVEIRAGSGKTVAIHGTKSGRRADEVTIEAHVRGDTVVIEPKYPRRGNVDVRVDFVVELPASVAVEAEVVEGEIVADGVNAALALSTVDGNITTTACGDVRGNTVNGRVHVALPQRGAKQVALEAVNGALELHMSAATGAKVRADTVSGKIRSDFPLSVRDEVVGSHADGTIGDGAVAVELATVNGAIRITKSS